MVILDQLGDACDGVSTCLKAGADVVQTAAKFKCKEIENDYVTRMYKKSKKLGLDLTSETDRTKFSELKSAVLGL